MWQEATIDVSTLCLGNTPPEFYCIQTLEQSMDGYDVVSFHCNWPDL